MRRSSMKERIAHMSGEVSNLNSNFSIILVHNSIHNIIYQFLIIGQSALSQSFSLAIFTKL